MRARQLLEAHRKDCVEQQLYFEAAVADTRAKELMQLERAWHRQAAAARFVAERRDMGHRFQREFQELLKEAHKSCKALQGEKRRRRRQLRQRQANMPASKEDGCEDDGQEAAEEENITVDDVVEVEETSRDKLIRNFFSMSTFPKETLPQVPEQEKNELLAPLQAPPPGVPRHSAESLNLRHKARKLGLAQRYVEAAKLQKEAERMEAEWCASKYRALEAKDEGLLEERHALERLRLEERLEHQEAKLVEQSLRAQQLMLQRHDCSVSRLAARQRRAWAALGGPAEDMEQALWSAAGRCTSKEGDCRKMRRSASTPAARRPKSAMA